MLVIVGSNSSTSINEQLTKAVLKELDLKNEFIDLKSLNIPMFSEDLERDIKSPEGILFLLEKLATHQHIFIATNEHNGTVSAFLKNIFDWLSRIQLKFLADKKVFILSTSNGKRGGLGANETLQKLVTRFGCEVFEYYAFSAFSDNFDINNQKITNETYLQELENKLNTLLKA
ncbi:MAG: NADPH-dependent FMN reductase [Myroides sp.]|nr:NADPH-dependent FMN reductase [Myroides sp.]